MVRQVDARAIRGAGARCGGHVLHQGHGAVSAARSAYLQLRHHVSVCAKRIALGMAWVLVGYVLLALGPGNYSNGYFRLQALAHDDGRYANNPLHQWFESLASGKGNCCSYADGLKLEEPDWRSHDGHYQVHIPAHSVPRWESGKQIMVPDEDTWIDVPDIAVITTPNKSGETYVWPYSPYYDGPGIQIRCFLPGAGT